MIDSKSLADDIVIAVFGRRNAHIDLQGKGRLYVRRSVRYLGNEAGYALDLADITVNEDCRGYGVFSATLHAVEIAAAKLGCTYVYVQSIQNPIVRGTLERRGYLPRPGFPQDMWTLTDQPRTPGDPA